MKDRPLFFRLLVSYLFFILLTLSVSTGLFISLLRNFHLEQTRIDLQDQTTLIEDQVRPFLKVRDDARAEALLQTLGRKIGSRLTLILPNGQVVADSAEDPRSLDNHADRPEFREAMAGGTGSSLRHSFSVHTSMLYVATPVVADAKVIGVIRAAKPIQSFNQTLATAYPGIVLGSLCIALAAALISLFVSRRISRPLERIKKAAERFAAGHLKKRIHIHGPAEVVALADTLNLMAAGLQERIDTIINQHNEQDAVLSSMVEGVLAVDNEERILRINQAALKLLAVTDPDPREKPVQEVVRKADLLRFIRLALAASEPLEDEILLQQEDRQLHFQVHGMPLKNSLGSQIGALIVFNDVSHLRRLENIRRDFVANVSHELKTPITAIKGFVETLLDGALNDAEEGRRFLGIIAQQAERLHAIIEDLLRLSRIEQEERSDAVPLETQSLTEVLNASILSCLPLAETKSIRIALECSENLKAAINPPLFEQALVNLIDNAVKYSEPKAQVLVKGEELTEGIRVSVRDWGTGIPEEHLPRIFERFYRVDKARSRKLGGTGLGLAIVKHIVQIHHGSVSVESAPGQGSTFAILLPLPEKRF
ncbi:MAG: HAMP domain-containing protein [Deltaproteobacteria bacterium]|nr:HAMP domain-containing protein [Deltaproteobacteria bacterium]